MIEWQEPKEPDVTCPYNYLVGRTPFGDILITWKSWKDYKTYALDEPEWLVGRYYAGQSLDEVKAWCEAEYARIVLAAAAALKEAGDD